MKIKNLFALTLAITILTHNILAEKITNESYPEIFKIADRYAVNEWNNSKNAEEYAFAYPSLVFGLAEKIKSKDEIKLIIDETTKLKKDANIAPGAAFIDVADKALSDLALVLDKPLTVNKITAAIAPMIIKLSSDRAVNHAVNEWNKSRTQDNFASAYSSLGIALKSNIKDANELKIIKAELDSLKKSAQLNPDDFGVKIADSELTSLETSFASPIKEKITNQNYPIISKHTTDRAVNYAVNEWNKSRTPFDFSSAYSLLIVALIPSIKDADELQNLIVETDHLKKSAKLKSDDFGVKIVDKQLSDLAKTLKPIRTAVIITQKEFPGITKLVAYGYQPWNAAKDKKELVDAYKQIVSTIRSIIMGQHTYSQETIKSALSELNKLKASAQIENEKEVSAADESLRLG